MKLMGTNESQKYLKDKGCDLDPCEQSLADL
jgi:hypothetical protein